MLSIVPMSAGTAVSRPTVRSQRGSRVSGPFYSRVLRRVFAKLLLTLGLLPTGPVMGMGAVAPQDLGLQISEAAPKLGAHITLTKRTTSLALAQRLRGKPRGERGAISPRKSAPLPCQRKSSVKERSCRKWPCAPSSRR